MLYCEMRYAEKSANGQAVKLHCKGIGTFDVKSGKGAFHNNPHCADHENAAIPVGEYWIVDRPKGGLYTRILAAIADSWYCSRHEEWFALYSIHTRDNHLYVNGVRRFGFRLHPVNPNGRGESEGCITLLSNADFQVLRKALLYATRCTVTGTNIQAYGVVKVIGEANYALCHVH